MSPSFEKPVKFVVVWSLSIFFSILPSIGLLFTYLIRYKSKPWKPKDRTQMEPPACLSDPKYGTHKYATVNGIRLHYVESGDKSKPLMVLVHGFPEFWYSYRHQITEFNKDYWVVALDLRGYNESDKPKGVHNYKVQHIVDDLKAFIEHLDRKCILVCHDWGAIIGWQFVAQNKNLVQKYVMLAVPAQNVYVDLAFSAFDQFKRSWYFFFFKMPFLPEQIMSAGDFSIFLRMWDGKFTENFNKDDLDAYKYVYSRKGALTPVLNYYRANSSFVNEPEIYKNDGSDGLFILAKQDIAVSQKAGIAMAKKYPKLRIESINANHFLHQFEPAATNALIQDFLGPASNYTVESALSK